MFWPTAIELPVLAFTQGRVSVNWFEVSGSQCRFDLRLLMSRYPPGSLVALTLAACLPQTN